MTSYPFYLDQGDISDNATVTVKCIAIHEFPTISQFSVSTISSSSASSEKTLISTRSPTMKSSTQLFTPETSTNAFFISTSSTLGNTHLKTDGNNPTDSDQTVIIAVSAGAGVFLLLVTIILIICCYR